MSAERGYTLLMASVIILGLTFGAMVVQQQAAADGQATGGEIAAQQLLYQAESGLLVGLDTLTSTVSGGASALASKPPLPPGDALVSDGTPASGWYLLSVAAPAAFPDPAGYRLAARCEPGACTGGPTVTGYRLRCLATNTATGATRMLEVYVEN